jgi:maleate isomerase
MSSYRIGVLTPSSNTALEPLTTEIIRQVPNLSAHFGRFRVTEISMAQQALGQFDDSNILQAAELLSDAKPDVMVWSGTSAGWLGFDKDKSLCDRLTERVGVPASTAILALNELIDIGNVTRLAIVSPYTSDIQQRIIEHYEAAGVQIVANVKHDISVNYDFALLSPQQIKRDLAAVARAKPQAVVTYCTNLHAAHLAEIFESETDITLLDTVSTAVWGAMRKINLEPANIKGWGRLFNWK